VEPGWQWHRVDGSDVVTHVNNAINNDVEQIVAPDFFCFFNTSLETCVFAHLPSHCNQRCRVRDVHCAHLLLATVLVSVKPFLRSGSTKPNRANDTPSFRCVLLGG
jgi:hypothetical protein